MCLIGRPSVLCHGHCSWCKRRDSQASSALLWTLLPTYSLTTIVAFFLLVQNEPPAPATCMDGIFFSAPFAALATDGTQWPTTGLHDGT